MSLAEHHRRRTRQWRKLLRAAETTADLRCAVAALIAAVERGEGWALDELYRRVRAWTPGASFEATCAAVRCSRLAEVNLEALAEALRDE